MRTIETEVYTYAELSDAAKAKARDWWREASAGDTYHLEHVTDDAAECLKALGFDLAKPRGRRTGWAIDWSLGYCQGDGCAFDATWRAEDMREGPMLADRPATFERDGKQETCETNAQLHALAGRLIELRKAGANWAKVSSGSRGNWTTLEELEWSDETPESTDCDRGETEFGELCRDFAGWIYWRLRAENDYQNADEQIAEVIEANGYEFTADGKIFG